jgi:hypothetical protein
LGLALIALLWGWTCRLNYQIALRIKLLMGRAGLSLTLRIPPLLHTLLQVETQMLNSGGEVRFRPGEVWGSLGLPVLRVRTLR